MSKDDDYIRKALERPERDRELIAQGEELKLYPLAGWSTGTLPENYVLLGLEFLTQPPNIEARILRLGMTRAQCSELSQVLARLARIPHVLPPAKPS